MSKSRVFIFMFALMLLLSSCASDEVVSTMEISLGTNSPFGLEDEGAIYINDDMDKLELNAKLKVDSGSVTVEVINLSSEEAVYRENYSEDSVFIIELTDLKAESKYSLKIHAIQSKNVKLTITSDVKLVKKRDKPMKEKVQ